MASASAGIVAIVDDDVHFLRALERALQSYGYRVLCFPSAVEYLAADWHPFACVVIDMELGGSSMSGLELGAEVAARGRGLPIVYMTASADPALRDQARRQGCAAFLEKPFFTERLVAVIMSLDALDSGAATSG